MPDERKDVRPKVVLDSNVLISGFAFERGSPAQIIEMLRDGDIVVCISPFILEEMSRSFREDFEWGESEIEEIIRLLSASCKTVDPKAEAAVIELTAADNRILDCATHGDVEFIVTGDKGIRRLGEYRGVKILTPAEFLGTVSHSQ